MHQKSAATSLPDGEFSVAKPGKYLTFYLADGEFGAEILKIREIIGVMDITALPMTSVYLKGIINLRGRVIPVIDLRLKLGMSEKPYTPVTCIIVVSVKDSVVGILVDTVSEVVDIGSDQIEPAPNLGSKVKTEFILGIGKVRDTTKILLDLDAVLLSDYGAIKQIVRQSPAPEMVDATDNSFAKSP